jgi:hypothetical protein
LLVSSALRGGWRSFSPCARFRMEAAVSTFARAPRTAFVTDAAHRDSVGGRHAASRPLEVGLPGVPALIPVPERRAGAVDHFWRFSP